MAIGILASLKHFLNLNKQHELAEIMSRRLEAATQQEWAISAILEGDLGRRARDKNSIEHFRNVIGNIDWIFSENSFSFEDEKEKVAHEVRIKSLRERFAEIGVGAGYSPETFDQYIKKGYIRFSAAGFSGWLERFITIKESPQDKIKELIIESNDVLLKYLRDESVRVQMSTLESIERTLN